MRKFSIGPTELIASLWRNRSLIVQMSWRETVGRYKGSILGLAWSFFNPLLMLAIYTFVFSVVFKARWNIGGEESKADFAIILFVGLIVHGIFAECINRAPTLILSNINYAKKVVFPLEILPWVVFGSALFHLAISLVVLMVVQLFLGQPIPPTIVLIPIVLLPLVFCIMGLAWLFASLGVYFRDLTQVTGVFSTIMLFLSAVFFPIKALPESFHFLFYVNPLAIVIEQSRDVLIYGEIPNLVVWCAMMALGYLMAWAGFAWFQKTRKGFADVL